MSTEPAGGDAPEGRARAAFVVPPWAWSFVAAALVWGASAAFTRGQGAGGTLTAALSFGTFYVIAGLGQMLVIALGPGNVDLSIPATITLAGAVAMKVMGGADGAIFAGLAAAVAVGAAVGAANCLLIYVLRIPPIVATLSASFLVQSEAIDFGRGLLVKPPPALADFVSATPFGVPKLAVGVLVLTALVALVLARTVFGRSVLAIGQNPRAAWLAGVAVRRVRLVAYVLCAALAGLCGALLAGFSGGASLDMGAEYLLASIAVVVIGGSAVDGGRAEVAGIWGASLFLFLLVSMLNTFGLGAGIRLVLTGAIIIAVIAAAGGDVKQGR